MEWSKQIGRYIIVMLLQVLLFDQLQLWGVCHPYIYVMCLLMMPITISRSLSMVIGALAGIVMDVFCNTLGVHMASCILLMFIRPYLVSAVVNDKDRLNEQLTLHVMGMEAFIKYVAILVVIHHLTVFSLAAWSWSHMGFALLETAVSSIITISVILGYNAVKYK